MNRLFGLIILVFTSLLFIVSCADAPSKMVIPTPKMIKVLAEVHVAEASSRSLPDNIKDSIRQQIFGEIYKDNRVSSDDFENTMDYLSLHPAEFESLYDSVEVYLKRQSSAK